jgi:hypothetical protein
MTPTSSVPNVDHVVDALTSNPDLHRLLGNSLTSPEVRQVLRDVLSARLAADFPPQWHAGLPPSELGAVGSRLQALRSETKLEHSQVEQILDEHRRDFRRGPLLDEE